MSAAIRNRELNPAAGWSSALAALLLLASAIGCSGPTNAADGPPGMLLWETAVTPAVASSDELIARGRRIYGVRCAGCHGADGNGMGPASLYLDPAPRDFTTGIFKFRTTTHALPMDEDLFRSVTAGFPAYGMPSFAYLPAKDRWAVVHFIKTFYPEWDRGMRFGAPEAVQISAEPAAQADDHERGKFLYTQHFKCVNCHGPTGHGDGPLSAGLIDSWGRPISPRDYTLGPTYRKAGWRRADIVRTAYVGITGTPMYPHDSLLEDPNDMTDLWIVARYVEEMIAAAQAQ